MKPISYKQEMGDIERICTREGTTGSCLGFSALENNIKTFTRY